MMKRIFVSLAIIVTCALALAACGGSDSTTGNGSSANASNQTTSTTTTTATPATTSSSPATTPTTTTSSPASTSTASSGDKIGVPECDDYLTKYEACISGKVPEAARAGYSSTLNRTRQQWRKLAETPQGKTTLASACKLATEQSRQTMKSFGCEF
jgi:hypothetical protein